MVHSAVEAMNVVMPEGEKIWGGAVVISGDNLSSAGWNRVNWSAKYWGGASGPPGPPVPASLERSIINDDYRGFCCINFYEIGQQLSSKSPIVSTE